MCHLAQPAGKRQKRRESQPVQASSFSFTTFSSSSSIFPSPSITSMVNPMVEGDVAMARAVWATSSRLRVRCQLSSLTRFLFKFSDFIWDGIKAKG